jgi:hypothetical protein
MAESRCVLPVLYSMRPPGSATIGWSSAARTQSRLLTQAPYSLKLVDSSPDCIDSRCPMVMARLRGSTPCRAK